MHIVLNIDFGKKGELMQKLKKMDTKVGQTVFSFKCPCGVCSPTTCVCGVKPTAYADTRVWGSHYMNSTQGGSATGGAGR